MSTIHERLDKLEDTQQSKTPEPQPLEKKSTCIFCSEPNHTRIPDNILVEVIRVGFENISQAKIERMAPSESCRHNNDLMLKSMSLELYNFLNYTINYQMYFDFSHEPYGICDIDTHRRGELIELFKDHDTLQFILMRTLDEKLAEMKKYIPEIDGPEQYKHFISFVESLDAEDWWNHQTDEMSRIPDDIKSQYIRHSNHLTEMSNYEKIHDNLFRLIKSIPHDVLDSLAEKHTIHDSARRHMSDSRHNLEANPETKEKFLSDFSNWLTAAEKKIGRRHVYRNFGDANLAV